MTIREAIDDIKTGVTDRKSLGLATRALESFPMMEEYINDRLKSTVSEDKKEAFKECLDLFKSVEDMIEKKE